MNKAKFEKIIDLKTATDTIRHIMEESFGSDYKCYLVSRGSKHDDNYKRKIARIRESAEWKKNI